MCSEILDERVNKDRGARTWRPARPDCLFRDRYFGCGIRVAASPNDYGDGVFSPSAPDDEGRWAGDSVSSSEGVENSDKTQCSLPTEPFRGDAATCIDDHLGRSEVEKCTQARTRVRPCEHRRKSEL